jgi:predicted dehydrogenase
MIRFAVIGYGYWGPNLVRNAAEVADADVALVVDRRPERLELAKRRHPGITTVTDAQAAFDDPQIDAVVIATPVSTHYELAHRALHAGKHVLVEKPICFSSEDALRLVDEAAARRLVLMVDHTFTYTGAVRKIKSLIDSGQIGKLYYYDSVRINLGLFQSDVSVLWDLAVHDLSIMDYLLGRTPEAISCTGSRHVPGHPEDVAYLTLYFSDNLIAHFHVNWLSPVKLRRTLIGGSNKMIVYDDLEPAEKVRVHDKGLIFAENPERLNEALLRGYRSGDVWSPEVDLTEALRTELNHFVDCIARRAQPITDGEAGLRVVRLLETAEISLKNQGVPVECTPIARTTV